MNVKLRKLVNVCMCVSPLFVFTSFCFVKTTNSNLDNTASTNFNQSISRTIDAKSVQNIALDNIIPYEDFPTHNTTRSFEFSEIFIAPRNNPNNRFFSLTKNGNNLVFKQEKSEAELEQDCNLDSRPMPPNSFVLSRSQILLQEVAWDNRGIITTTDLLNSYPDKSVGVTFDQLYGRGYFKTTGASTLTFPIRENANYVIKFHIASQDENNPLTVFFKSNNNTYFSLSDSNDLHALNYINADNNKHTGIETIFGLSTDNKYVISYDDDSRNLTSIFRLEINTQEIISKLGNYKASEALNYLVIDKTNDNEIAWRDVISLSGQIFLPIQYKQVNLAIEANDARGEITVSYNVPYEFTYKSTNGQSFRTIDSVSNGGINSIVISGFNAGTSIATSTVNASNANINGLPQKIINDRSLTNQLKQLIFNQCFTSGSVLENFSPITDLKLNQVTFNNLTGTIDCELILLNNYIDKDGNEVTSNIEKSMGQIKIINLNKISATAIKNQTVNISSDSPLSEILPSQAKNHINELKELIYDNINNLLNNIPNASLANRNIAPGDIIINENDINQIGSNFIVLSKILITHYYNNQDGSYENNTPLTVTNVRINGFFEAQYTYIKNEVFQLENMNRVNVDDYSEIDALTFLRQKQNDGELLWPVDSLSFNPATDMKIKDGTWNTNAQKGEIKFVLQARNIFGVNANFVTEFVDLGTITLKGFKQIVKTQLITTSYDVHNFFGNAVADEVTADNIKSLLIKLFSENKLFNSYDDQFNPNTDIDVKNSDLTINALNGTISVRVNAKNIYSANLTVARDFTYVGTINLFNFNKKISTIVENGVFNINSLPSSFHDLYANEVTVDTGKGNFNDIIRAFSEKNMILKNLPNNFNFQTNLTNIEITPVKIDEEWAVSATFKINNYLVDGKEMTTPFLSCSITLIGFKQLQSTRINGTIFNPNVSLLKVNCLKQHRTYDASVIQNQISDFGTKIIVGTDSQSILSSPLIEIENNPVNDPLVLDFSNATYSASGETSILFSNVLVSGSYYSNDDLYPVPIMFKNTKIMNIELSGFGKREVTYIPLIVTISIIIAAVTGAVILVLIVIKFYNKVRIAKRRKDAYEDTVTRDMSF